MSNELIVRNGLIVRGANTTSSMDGAVIITGSLTVLGATNFTASQAVTSAYAVSASYLINMPDTASWAYNAITASYAHQATTASYAQNFNPLGTASYAINAATASNISLDVFRLATMGVDIVSSSAQILVDLQSSNIVSSSAQTIVNLQSSGIASGSAQVVTYVSGQKISPLEITSSLFGTASYASLAETSSYISSTVLTNGAVGTNIVSGSAQTIVNLQSSGIASSSVQVVTYVSGTQISPLGITSSLLGTASWAANAITASYVNTADTASYVSAAVLANGAIGTNIVSSSAQTIVNLQSSGIASGSAQVVTYVSGTQISPAGVTSSLFGTASVAITASNVSYSNISGITSTTQFGGTASFADNAAHAESIEYSKVTGITAVTQFGGTASFADNAAHAESIEYSKVTGITAATQFAGTASFASTAGALVSGINLNVTQLTASAIQVTDLHVVNITSSVIYASGSNIFGNKLTDTHQFTGSVSITGSLVTKGPITGTTLTVNTTGVPATLSTTETTGVTGFTVLDSFATTGVYAVKWLVSLRSTGTDHRTSEIIASWDAGSAALVYSEFSTTDVGNTAPVVFSVDIPSGTDVRLIVTPATGNWGVRTTRLLM